MNKSIDKSCFLFAFRIVFCLIFDRKSIEHPMKIDRNIVPKNDVNRNRENNENCNGASTRMNKSRWQYVQIYLKIYQNTIENVV